VIEVEVASLSNPGSAMELGSLWYAITGHRPEHELEGWAWFLREHLSEFEPALGPAFAETKRQFDQKQQESRELLLRYVPPSNLASRLRKFKRTPPGMVLMGLVGWIIAALLLVFILIR
jgi:hypothetical protein